METVASEMSADLFNSVAKGLVAARADSGPPLRCRTGTSTSLEEIATGMYIEGYASARKPIVISRGAGSRVTGLSGDRVMICI
jgi:hypothetical protein